ncbi:MAG: stage III sporulation protein AD [Clostridia bacterium]|nr:stage III sporulation protein AD [Clostridia bacterium]
MIFLKIIGIGLITTVATLIVKQIKPEIAMFITLAGSILILFEIVGIFTTVVETFLHLTELTGIDQEIFQIVLKIIGIGYLTEFTANLCSDSGMNSVADKVLLGGKVVILIVALPIINTLIEIITSLLNLC